MEDKRQVLVVEDEEAIRRGVCDLLVFHGYQPTAASRGDDGLALALGRGFGLVILDLMLPGMNGLAVASTWASSFCPLSWNFCWKNAATAVFVLPLRLLAPAPRNKMGVPPLLSPPPLPPGVCELSPTLISLAWIRFVPAADAARACAGTAREKWRRYAPHL